MNFGSRQVATRDSEQRKGQRGSKISVAAAESDNSIFLAALLSQSSACSHSNEAELRKIRLSLFALSRFLPLRPPFLHYHIVTQYHHLSTPLPNMDVSMEDESIGDRPRIRNSQACLE